MYMASIEVPGYFGNKVCQKANEKGSCLGILCKSITCVPQCDLVVCRGIAAVLAT